MAPMPAAIRFRARPAHRRASLEGTSVIKNRHLAPAIQPELGDIHWYDLPDDEADLEEVAS